MKSKQLLFGGFSLLFVVIALVYVLQSSRLLGNILFLIPPLLAVLAGLYAARTYHFGNVHGKAMALFAAGLLCFFTGEFIFFLFQFVFHTDPFPSIADAFYLAAYPLLLAGFVTEIKFHKVRWQDFNKLILMLMVLLMLALAVIVSYFGIYLAYDSGASFASNAIAIGYGIADLVILVPSLFILKMALDYRGGKLFNAWALLALAIVLMMAGDILFAIFNDQYTALNWPAPLIDLVWVASYLVFAYSFIYIAATIKELRLRLQKG